MSTLWKILMEMHSYDTADKIIEYHVAPSMHFYDTYRYYESMMYYEDVANQVSRSSKTFI